MERLEKPTQDQLSKLVAEAVVKQERMFNIRMEEVVTDFETKINERLKVLRLR